MTMEATVNMTGSAEPAVHPSRAGRSFSWTFLIVVTVLSAVLIGTAFADVSREVTGISISLLVLLWIFSGLPVGAALGIPGVIGVFALAGERPLHSALGNEAFTNAASISLSVLPMFIMMGLLLWRSGITSDFYRASKLWLGWMPGGLAVTTNVAGAGLGAASGSTLGIAYAIGRIGIPEMLKAGYDKRLATGSVISAGTIGQLIPPSILMVVFAGFAQVPVGPQLLAGVIPGLLLTVAYGLLTVLIAVVWPRFAPRTDNSDVKWSERIRALFGIWPLFALILVIVGGMLSGFFTPTEAGSVGALITFVFCMVRLGWKEGGKASLQGLKDTLGSVGSIMFLLLGAALLNYVLALSGLAQGFASALSGANLSPLGFMLIMMVMYLIMGCIMDPIAMMLLTLPMVLPVATELGISTLVFGVFVVLMGEVALMTPPVGMLIFLLYRLSQDRAVRGNQKVSMGDVMWGSIWYIPAALFMALLVVVVPDIVTFLPELSAGTD